MMQISAVTLHKARIAMTMLLLLLGYSLFASSCIWHYNRHLPERIAIQKPPKKKVASAMEKPAPPKQLYFIISTGALFGGGWFPVEQSSQQKGIQHFGFETSFFFGYDKYRAIPSDPSTLLDFHLPTWQLGINFGWNLFDPRFDVVYGMQHLELQFSAFGAGVALGYAWHPADLSQHGIQGTAHWGPLYIRIVHLWEQGTEVSLGIQLKWPFVFVFTNPSSG